MASIASIKAVNCVLHCNKNPAAFCNPYVPDGSCRAPVTGAATGFSVIVNPAQYPSFTEMGSLPVVVAVKAPCAYIAI